MSSPSSLPRLLERLQGGQKLGLCGTRVAVLGARPLREEELDAPMVNPGDAPPARLGAERRRKVYQDGAPRVQRRLVREHEVLGRM